MQHHAAGQGKTEHSWTVRSVINMPAWFVKCLQSLSFITAIYIFNSRVDLNGECYKTHLSVFTSGDDGDISQPICCLEALATAIMAHEAACFTAVTSEIHLDWLL